MLNVLNFRPIIKLLFSLNRSFNFQGIIRLKNWYDFFNNLWVYIFWDISFQIRLSIFCKKLSWIVYIQRSMLNLLILGLGHLFIDIIWIEIKLLIILYLLLSILVHLNLIQNSYENLHRLLYLLILVNLITIDLIIFSKLALLNWIR